MYLLFTFRHVWQELYLPSQLDRSKDLTLSCSPGKKTEKTIKLKAKVRFIVFQFETFSKIDLHINKFLKSLEMKKML